MPEMPTDENGWVDYGRVVGWELAMSQIGCVIAFPSAAYKTIADNLAIHENVERIRGVCADLPGTPWEGEFEWDLYETIDRELVDWAAWTSSRDCLLNIVNSEITRWLERYLCVECRGTDLPVQIGVGLCCLCESESSEVDDAL